MARNERCRRICPAMLKAGCSGVSVASDPESQKKAHDLHWTGARLGCRVFELEADRPRRGSLSLVAALPGLAG